MDGPDRTERQQRKLRGLRKSHPGLREYGLDADGHFRFATPGGFVKRGMCAGQYRYPEHGRIAPDGRISWD